MTAAKKTTKPANRKKAAKGRSAAGFSDAERAAMKERAEELKATGRGGMKKSDDAKAVLAKIAEMPEPDRTLAERIHALVASVAPQLAARTWYGMPAYAKDGKVVCYFQTAEKFESRYATLGFSDLAKLDDGTMWPTSFAVTDLTKADVQKIESLIERAVSE
jgi:uncharacterized protein YdhG (YjbR/CyaY superfamily)